MTKGSVLSTFALQGRQPMRIVKHKNVWADSILSRTTGYMQGRNGQRISYRNRVTRMVATCLADTPHYYLSSRITPLRVNGQLWLRQAGHAVKVNRLTGRHLIAAIRRLNKIRKTI